MTKFVSYCTIIMEKGSVIMNDKITLTANDILEKEFKIDARGYRLQEVDKFLDIIIKDYTEYDKLLRKYNTELKAVLEENTKLKIIKHQIIISLFKVVKCSCTKILHFSIFSHDKI